MKRLSLVLVVLAALWATVPVTAANAAPALAGTTAAKAVSDSAASAWAIHIAVSAPVSQGILEVASASARSGKSPTASGTPLSLGGQSPITANVIGTGNSVPKSVLQYACGVTYDVIPLPKEVIGSCGSDPTASLIMEGGFAEAHAGAAQSSARSGFGSMTASGFPLASKTLTWDQQTALLNAWGGTWEQIASKLNSVVTPLAPVLELAGLKVPHFEAWTGLGLVDVSKGRAVTTNADTASSDNFSSARATTAVGDIKMFAGFIEAQNVAVQAVSESAGGSDTRTAAATVGRLKIAGIEVVADNDGFRAAGNDVLSRAVVQPALDALMFALSSGGMTLHVSDTAGTGNFREATALGIEITSTAGSMMLSVGHAEASAPSASFDSGGGAAPTNVLPTSYEPSTETVIPGDSSSSYDGGSTVLPTDNGSVVPSSNNNSGQTYAGGYIALPQSAVRSARTTYLLLILLGGLVGALVLPMMARPAPVRRLGASIGKGRAR